MKGEIVAEVMITAKKDQSLDLGKATPKAV